MAYVGLGLLPEQLYRLTLREWMLLVEREATRYDEAWDRTAVVVSILTRLHSKHPLTLEEARPARRLQRVAAPKQLTEREKKAELRDLKTLFRGR